jgi:glucose/arabinose dehydrogenase
VVVADFRAQVHNFWDRGLLGMALDPQFTSGRPFIYILYTYDGTRTIAAPRFGTTTSVTDPGPDATGNGAIVTGRLSRFTVGTNNQIQGSEQVLIWDWDQQFPSHSIGDIKFGPDGNLYASSGDGASFNYVDTGQTGNPFAEPNGEGGAVRSQDVRSTGDPTTLDGTIIRVNPNTGDPVAGSPFAARSDVNDRRIVAFGLRNPFRIWAADVGWGSFEEINRVMNASDNVAENFGWPAFEGPNRQSGYDGANVPLLESLYTSGGDTKPYYAWNHSEQVAPGSGEPTGGSSATGVAFYTGGNYPVAFNNAMFFADYSRKRIYVAYAGPNGLPDMSTRQVFAALPEGAVELTTGPNGDLFFVDLQGNRIVRVTATGYNRSPTARITSDRTAGSVPLTVNFSGASSTDPDPGATLSYAWDLNGDGAFTDSTSATPSFTYTTPGTYNVGLRVTDNGGFSNTTTLQIRAGANAPVPTITSFTNNWSVGQTITLTGSATDVEDGTLAGSRLNWDVIIIHGNDIDPTNTHEHPVNSLTGNTVSFVAPDHESPSWIVVRLTATDSSGLTTTVSQRLDPRVVQLSVNSNPTGLQFAFNGSTFTAPFNRSVIAGSANSITALSPQAIGTSTYIFNNWSQGGAASQNIIRRRVARASDRHDHRHHRFVRQRPRSHPRGRARRKP